MPATMADLQSKQNPNWCPGCGDYGIQVAIKQAIIGLGLETKDVMIVGGIGCGSKLPQWVNTYGFETLHGRLLPVASGAHLANTDLKVIGVGGDGDGYGIGMGHFVHTMRRNMNMCYFVQNNQTYGLTKGQMSPTTSKGTKTTSTPYGAIEEPVNPIHLALAMGATYIARGYAGDVPHLVSLMKGAIEHRGFAFIDVLQPCVTFNKVNTYAFFHQRVYKLEDEEGYKTDDKIEAWKHSAPWNDKIATGLFYKEDKPTYEDEEPGFAAGVLAKRTLGDADMAALMGQFT